MRAWLAWHIAALTRMNAKKFPKLKAFIGGDVAKPKRQSVSDMQAVAMAWHQVINASKKPAKRGR